MVAVNQDMCCFFVVGGLFGRVKVTGRGGGPREEDPTAAAAAAAVAAPARARSLA